MGLSFTVYIAIIGVESVHARVFIAQPEIFGLNSDFYIMAYKEKSTTSSLVEASANQHATLQKQNLSIYRVLLTWQLQINQFLEQKFAKNPNMQPDLSYLQLHFGV